MRIAIIGTRGIEFLHEGKQKISEYARRCAERHWIIRTGAAPGTDQCAGRECLEAGGTVELVLPWASFESTWVSAMEVFFPQAVKIETYAGYRDISRHSAWTKSVFDHHPNGYFLRPGAFCLHARNFGIIEPCDAVLALPRPPEQGGTGQGMRVARALGKPLFNLNLKTDIDALNTWLLEHGDS